MQTLLPGLFTVLVMAVAAHLALAGEISVGMMATFYGIAAFLGRPLWEATESLNALTQSTVGSARVLRILAVAPSPAHGEVKPQHRSVERITLRDERGLPDTPGADGPHEEVFQHDGGISEFVDYLSSPAARQVLDRYGFGAP